MGVGGGGRKQMTGGGVGGRKQMTGGGEEADDWGKGGSRRW